MAVVVRGPPAISEKNAEAELLTILVITETGWPYLRTRRPATRIHVNLWLSRRWVQGAAIVRRYGATDCVTDETSR